MIQNDVDLYSRPSFVSHPRVSGIIIVRGGKAIGKLHQTILVVKSTVFPDNQFKFFVESINIYLLPPAHFTSISSDISNKHTQMQQGDRLHDNPNKPPSMDNTPDWPRRGGDPHTRYL